MKYETMLYNLKVEGNEWLKENFDLTLRIPLIANSRFTRTLGSFLYDNDAPMRIELSTNLLDAGYEAAFDILTHELVHYALYMKGKPFDDKDEYFIQTCNSLGVGLSETRSVPTKYYIYVCETCGYETRSLRKDRDGYYVHTDCNGAFNFSRTIIE